MTLLKKTLTLRTAAKTAILLLFLSSMLVRCANTTTPQGGPRDTIPPVLMVATPENHTTKFAAKRIFVEFNEYVQLKDQHKEFFTSPRMKTKPTLSIRGRGVLIDIKDTLRDDQTYVLNFGASLRDNNEGNPLHSFSYVFSTGEEIDSMWMSGYTADAQKSDSVAKSYIYFYRRLCGGRIFLKVLGQLGGDDGLDVGAHLGVRFDDVAPRARRHCPCRDQRYLPG